MENFQLLLEAVFYMARSLKNAVAAFISGDASAFDDIYSLTYRSVFIAAKLLMKNEQDAEDIAQGRD